MEAEQAVRESAKAGAMDSVILRLGNVYGPGSGFLIPEIANAILKRGALYTFLPFYEDRYIHPLYIDDAVSGTVEALTGEDGSGIFILAGPEYVTIGRLFSLVARVLGMPLGTTQKKSLFDGLRLSIRNAVRHFKRRADMVVYLMAGSRGRIHRAYSIERAKASLGYEPAFDTERGVRETLEWAKREGIVRW
jgi:nucleoside-diphosphate-sugar epimerase